MIEARRLHILRAVADHRTVTAAAAALYLTPSAVSQQLTALEQETGHRLVERGAQMAVWHAAALGRVELLEGYFANDAPQAKYPWGASRPSAPG